VAAAAYREAELLLRLGRDREATMAYRLALASGLPPAERAYITARMADTDAG
jgi:predicted RNA polymerase sigma factor